MGARRWMRTAALGLALAVGAGLTTVVARGRGPVVSDVAPEASTDPLLDARWELDGAGARSAGAAEGSPLDALRLLRRARFVDEPEAWLDGVGALAVARDPHLAPEAAVTLAALARRRRGAPPWTREAARVALDDVLASRVLRADLRRLLEVVRAELEPGG